MSNGMPLFNNRRTLMATINPVIEITKKFVNKITWTGDTADTFNPYRLNGVNPANISVQAIGGTSTLLGSNEVDGSSPYALTDIQGVAINLADTELSEVSQRPLTIVPAPVGTGVKVTLAIWS